MEERKKDGIGGGGSTPRTEYKVYCVHPVDASLTHPRQVEQKLHLCTYVYVYVCVHACLLADEAAAARIDLSLVFALHAVVDRE